MRVLLVGHRPGADGAETIALAAAAALCGVGADGRRLLEVGRLPSMREIAAEAGIRPEAVRRTLHELQRDGTIVLEGGGPRKAALVRVLPERMAARWTNPALRCRFDELLRKLPLRQDAMLLAGLVAGQLAPNGRARLGRQYLAARTGWALRRVDRALQAATRAGAIVRWTCGSVLHLGLGSAYASASKATNDIAPTTATKPANDIDQPATACHETGEPTATEPATACHETGEPTATKPANDYRIHPEYRTPTPEPGSGGAEIPPGPNQTPPQSPASARAVLAALRQEDARRALLASAGPGRVLELLGQVGFGAAHPERRAAVAAAIEQRHGADAVRWLLDELEDIAQDPAAVDVAAVLASRLQKGRLQEQPSPSGPGRPLRPSPHAAGASDRAATARRRDEEASQDPDRRLRGLVAGRILGDRADARTVAAELGVDEELVRSIAQTEQADRATVTGPQRIQAGAAAEDPEDAKHRRLEQLEDLYRTVKGIKPPSHVLAAWR